MELARAWFRIPGPTCPDELLALFASHPLTTGLELTDGRPESVTPLPERGEGRNHDLWLRGRARGGRTTICVEAKADEPLGEPIGRQLKTARRRQPNTGVPARARALLGLLFQRECVPEAAPWRDLRYQLLTALAGTAIQAVSDGSRLGILVIHEFHSADSDPAKLQRNQEDLDAFLGLLLPGSAPLVPGVLAGPIEIAPNPITPEGVTLMIGKLAMELATLTPSPEHGHIGS